jgi:hypothetical protein
MVGPTLVIIHNDAVMGSYYCVTVLPSVAKVFCDYCNAHKNVMVHSTVVIVHTLYCCNCSSFCCAGAGVIPIVVIVNLSVVIVESTCCNGTSVCCNGLCYCLGCLSCFCNGLSNGSVVMVHSSVSQILPPVPVSLNYLSRYNSYSYSTDCSS